MHQVPPDEPYGYQKWIRGSTYINGDDYDTFLKKAAPETGGIRRADRQAGRDAQRLGGQAVAGGGRPAPNGLGRQPVAKNDRRSDPAGQPLFLTTSFYAPHPPLFPPKKYFDAYLKKNLPPPAHGDWVNWEALPNSNKGKELHRVLLEGETLHAAQAGYFGQIEHIDDQIAPLIEEFRKRSEKAGRGWLIAFTSDHGEMLGDHGYFRKCEPYEGAANIPLIISGSPGLGFRPGLRSLRPVCLEDIMPTLLEVAGVKRPEAIDGVSLVPALRGEASVVRPWLHFEHATCYSKQQAFHALTDGRFKYIWRPLDGGEQLFDLGQDPKEEHDLGRDPAIARPWRAGAVRLVKRLANRPEGFSDGQRLIPGRPYPPLQKKLGHG